MILKQKGMHDDEVRSRLQIQPGLKLYGFCGGLFGRDSWGEKTVVAVRDNRIDFLEYDELGTSREVDGDIYTWAGLIKDSNRELEMGDRE